MGTLLGVHPSLSLETSSQYKKLHKLRGTWSIPVPQSSPSDLEDLEVKRGGDSSFHALVEDDM